MAFSIKGSLSEKLAAFKQPEAASSFVTLFDWCYRNDRDIPGAYRVEVYNACLLITGACSRPIQVCPETLSSENQSQRFRRKGAHPAIVEFAELLECLQLETSGLFPSGTLQTLQEVFLWMQTVKPTDLNDQSRKRRERCTAMQKVIGGGIKFPNLHRPPGLDVEAAVEEFFVEYMNAGIVLPIPVEEGEPPNSEVFDGLIDHVCSGVPPTTSHGELQRFKEAFRNYLGACICPEGAGFRKLCLLSIVPDEELEPVVQL